ncbi:MAG: 16S rRNA (cytosine(1402)-N(4))-methyltransferase RsmH [Syntrophobacterales bacterium]|jgi:16S rRNA (cytosine1402-N4)-methyltransferase|nr:16S rRNA (cytosine(1402)-N(4))-methyltransferase RsmH [Syntrophobacterales bacterium]
MGVTHIPVLLEEVLDNLVGIGTGLFVDATVGGAGHSYAILERQKYLRLVGLDVDEDNLRTAEEKLCAFEKRVTLVRGNFRDLGRILRSLDIESMEGILFDLGLSTYQMMGNRGFSFNDEFFLDMRMDNRDPVTAYDVVNGYGYEALKSVIEEFGEEYRAPKIARMIVEERKKKPISTARELSAVILKAKKRQGKIHPATKTFQALRIEVNQELNNMRSGLSDAIAMLAPKGRIGVISFHSLEDRIVKETFRGSPLLRLVTKKPIRPERPEVLLNPRARSAKLRVAEKL